MSDFQESNIGNKIEGLEACILMFGDEEGRRVFEESQSRNVAPGRYEITNVTLSGEGRHGAMWAGENAVINTRGLKPGQSIWPVHAHSTDGPHTFFPAGYEPERGGLVDDLNNSVSTWDDFKTPEEPK